MKKVLLSVGFAAFAGLVFGQSGSVNPNFLRKDTKNIFTIQAADNDHVTNVDRAIIWQNDFSTPSDWVLTNTGTPSANWAIGTTPPSGEYSAAMNAIASTTAANNFAKFDSDALGSGSSTQNALLTFGSPIDLSAHPAVLVQFQSYYRRFQGNCYLEVSTNNTTWTQFPLHTNVAVNASTANPVTVSVNPTAVIGGATTAYIRFRYVGAWDYAWMLDDVQIVDAPDNDIVLGNVFYGEYSKYPVGQEMPMPFWGKVTNFGGQPQTNVKLNVSVNGTAFGSSTAVPTLAPGAIDSLNIPGTYTPSGVGTYTLNFEATQSETDQNPADNAKTRVVSVTENTFSRDNNNYNGQGVWNQAGNGYMIGNLFEVSNPATVNSITVVLQANTMVGAEFRVVLLDDLTSNPVGVAESDFYTVTAANIPTGSGNNPVSVTIPFIVPVDIEAGDYFAMVDFGGGTKDLVLAAGTDIVQPIQTSFLYDPTESPATWFYITGCPMVRLNMNEVVTPPNSINENALTAAVNVFPNPASNLLNVSFSEISGNVVMTMFSTEGKQVMTQKTNVVANQTTTVDVSGLSAGIYTLRVVAGNGTVTKKVVIK